MTAYYNEIDPAAAQWLRNLIEAGHIAPGYVDERSIEDVYPSDLRGFSQCHFFAGIGVWSHALRQAGFADDRPIWTGSCPCQPFSAAGAGAGFLDQRHLWPAFHHLIKECRPALVLGEQVASKDANPWIDLVQTDLEALGYRVGAIAFPAASIGAPHIRDRLYWVADTHQHGRSALPVSQRNDAQHHAESRGESCGESCGVADNLMQQRPDGQPGICNVNDAGGRLEGAATPAGLRSNMRPGPVNGFWRDADWLGCRDGKWRPVSPKPQPLVDGSAESLGRVRAETIEEIEGEINAWSMESQIDRDQALRNLLKHLGATAQRCWTPGGIPGLHEAPFLLAFLRQLAEQGWGVAQRLPISCEEVAEASVRGVWIDGEQAGAPRQHGLEEQQAGERANAVSFLSSLLARHALTEWDDAFAAYAETGFPLAHGARSRVTRLRAYGNAICAPAAQAFIESVMGVAA